MKKPAFFRTHGLLIILTFISACTPGSPTPALRSATEPFDGLWTAAFMLETNTGSVQTSTSWFTFILDLQQEGEDVIGTIRSDDVDVSGVVRGIVDEEGVLHGTMRLSWDDHDWESLTLSFLPDGVSGTGTAIFKAAPEEFHLYSIQLHSPEYAGSVTPSPAPTESPTPEGRVVIRLLVDSFAEPALVAGVAAYNASQDDIHLELMVEQFEYDSLVTRLSWHAENGGGNLPDLIGPWSTDSLHQFPDPWLDLNPYLDGDELAAFDPNALRGWQNADGQLLGLPLNIYPSVIFYNRDLFDAAGLPYPPDRPGEPYADGEAWTIEKMESIAIQLTLDSDGRTPASADFDPADVKQYGLSHIADYCAGPITTLFGNPQPSVAADGKILLTDPWKEAIRWYYSAMWEKHFIPPAQAVDRWTALDSGQAAMVYAPTWYLASIKTLQTWDLAAVPAHNGQINSYADTLGLAALSTTRHPRESAQVLRYLASTPELFRPEGFRSGIALPALLDLQPPYLAELDAHYQQGGHWQVAVDSLPYSQYADYNIRTNPLCQYELMDRLNTTPGLDLEEQFHRAIFSR